MKPRGRLLYESGELKQRADQAATLLSNCRLCPRKCRVDRGGGETGICQTGDRAIIASYNPHFGEETPLVGKNGSGTIFFAGCNLNCCFCQNYDISHDVSTGIEVEPDRFASILLDLQQRGCHNINFVSPTHVVPPILTALLIAYEKGLQIPLVYNCSGYESIGTLELLDGVIDIYMPDFKFWSGLTAQKYAAASDYPEVARDAVLEMFKQVGDLEIDKNGNAARGLLIRHLLMPGAIDETEQILIFIADKISKSTYVNIMDQYRSCGTSYKHEELQTSIGPDHYRQAVDLAEKVGLTRLDERDVLSVLKCLRISL